MDSARGLYSRLSGNGPDQELDDEMDSLLSLPTVNPNQPREWLHIDAHGKTRYILVSSANLRLQLSLRLSCCQEGSTGLASATACLCLPLPCSSVSISHVANRLSCCMPAATRLWPIVLTNYWLFCRLTSIQLWQSLAFTTEICAS